MENSHQQIPYKHFFDVVHYYLHVLYFCRTFLKGPFPVGSNASSEIGIAGTYDMEVVVHKIGLFLIILQKQEFRNKRIAVHLPAIWSVLVGDV